MTTHTDPPNLPRPTDPDDERLPCGRLLSQVWDAWESDGATDPHLRECDHCRQAVHELEHLETAVRGLREEVPDTTSYDPTPLARRVMDVVRLELRPGRPLPLGEPAEDLWIMEAVAARTVRAAAETVTGVRAGSCRIAPVPAGTDRPDRVEVRLELHAPITARLPELAEEVRRRVREAAYDRLGLDTARIDIRVTDLTDDPADAPADTEGGRAR